MKDLSKLSISFSGCGFLCVYHAGVCAAIREFAPHLFKDIPILGASAGSIFGACIASDVCLSKTISIVLDVVAEARSYTFGALNRDFDLMRIIRRNLESVLPDNAHKLCTGRLHISVTRFSDFSNLMVSEFETREDLIDAIICSCFIPIYGGFDYPKYKGERCVDGGISINQPILDDNTISVSPFAGENDVCPSDVDSANLVGFLFSGTSIRFTMSNVMRVLVCLFPPPPEACSKICQQGFEDTLRYLFLNGEFFESVLVISKLLCYLLAVHICSCPNYLFELGVTSQIKFNDLQSAEHLKKSWFGLSVCGSCLTVQAELLDCESGGTTTQFEAVIAKQPEEELLTMKRVATRKALLKRLKVSECRSCLQLIDPLVKPPFERLFPRLIKQAFEDALKTRESYNGFFFSLKIVRLARTLLLPVIFFLQLFKFCKSFSFWFASYAFNEWFLASVKQSVHSLMREVRRESSARLQRAIDTSLEEVKVQSLRPSDIGSEKTDVLIPVFEAGELEDVEDKSVFKHAEDESDKFGQTIDRFSSMQKKRSPRENGTVLSFPLEPLEQYAMSLPERRIAESCREVYAHARMHANVDDSWLYCDQDCYFKAIEQDQEHENVMAFYYMDRSLRSHFCQLHGVDHDEMLKAIGVEASASASAY